ncbi:unnamed protein product [Cylindrotheca closterium]|uniref:Uncharacterized protein n=1 Tax=Cylindrotheca closterium TaxID=2856 RepID=A0AAD2FV30_9STRA|nr:unnamed protein product [Cylindrotheca closterium]
MHVEWLIHHLCFDENFSSAEIDIDLHDADVWDRLIRSLTRSIGLEELKITRSSDYQVRSDEDLEDLFRAIGSMAQLNRLELSEFSTLDLSSGRNTFENFLGVTDLQIDISEDSTPLSADVARSIVSIPKLRNISIATPCSFAVSNLFSPSIESILVEGLSELTFDDDNFRQFVEDLERDRVRQLSRLDILCVTIASHQVPLLANMLKQNSTLVELRLSLSIPNENVVNECCEEIIDAMSYNTVLQKFDNYKSRDIKASLATKKAQNGMLFHNTTLREFGLFGDDAFNDTAQEKNLYLRLNAAGRKRLLDVGPGSIHDWVEVLCDEGIRDNLPCLFYLLRMNPSLCQSYRYEQKDGTDETVHQQWDENEETRQRKKICK